MSVEQIAVDAAFASTIGRTARYFKTPGPAVDVRVIPSNPDLRRDVGSIELQSKQRLMDVRLSDVATPAQGDTLTLYIENPDGTLTLGGEVLEITKRPDRPDRLGLVWTLDLKPQVAP